MINRVKMIFRCVDGSHQLTSASIYLSLALIGSLAGLWCGYFWPEAPLIKGQALSVVIPLLFFPATAFAWVCLRGRNTIDGLTRLFLIFMMISWLLNIALTIYHHDLFSHLAWIVPVFLVMIYVKPPTASEGFTSLRWFASAIAAMLTITLLLEVVGIIQEKWQSPSLNSFNESHYFVPINRFLGIDGRWPGPFGDYNTTALFGSLLIVLALVTWRRGSWIFVVIGAITLLITDGRSALGAGIVGIAVFAVFSPAGRLGTIPRNVRAWACGVALALSAAYIFFRNTGLTGRQDFWPAFLNLWHQSPFIGVGTSGIATSGGITQEWGHAHNQYIDVLTRYGIIGLLPTIATLMVAIALSLAAAQRGVPGPLAIICTYVIAGVGDTRNDWVHPSPLVLLIVVTGVTAGIVSKDESLNVVNTKFP